MRSLIHPNATAVLIRDNTPRFQTLENTIVTLEKFAGDISESILDVVERVDEVEGDDQGGLATVTCRFQIDREGERYQVGSSTYSCWRDLEGRWIILSMADIARVQGDWDGKVAGRERRQGTEESCEEFGLS